MHQLELLKNQHAKSADDLKFRRKPTESILEDLGFCRGIKCIVLEKTSLLGLAHLSKELEVKTGKEFFVDREAGFERDGLQHRECHLLKKVGAEVFLD